ncbi:MAG: hypothetical protein CUN49_01600 [Candidatus Thermofonsia Clade 1 bacterium]|jgi:hypothetical protein|uniref:Uncharacterized protein n=1 Tax=Candidatus Thermofonsia Clade 1 bacterium TaxID=2364210 RepID=A0A2M8PI11_9CHLR|nr:MAG: hypothetical protein CUN49_01600 [Candidatus Thermofonsia Clade 1 bacterium]RMF53642.1 MAG: hypothetical protein D6749_01730 [Chloroflexota bacterium]
MGKSKSAADSQPRDDKRRDADIQPEIDLPTETLAETENYTVWVSQEPDGEMQYHLELGTGNVTVHFFQEEWDEFISLMRNIISER